MGCCFGKERLHIHIKGANLYDHLQQDIVAMGDDLKVYVVQKGKILAKTVSLPRISGSSAYWNEVVEISSSGGHLNFVIGVYFLF